MGKRALPKSLPQEASDPVEVAKSLARKAKERRLTADEAFIMFADALEAAFNKGEEAEAACSVAWQASEDARSLTVLTQEAFQWAEKTRVAAEHAEQLAAQAEQNVEHLAQANVAAGSGNSCTHNSAST